jgi:hypothetical protein
MRGLGLMDLSPRYAEAGGAFLGQLRHFDSDIYGNREFVEHLHERGKFFDNRTLHWNAIGRSMMSTDA